MDNTKKMTNISRKRKKQKTPIKMENFNKNLKNFEKKEKN